MKTVIIVAKDNRNGIGKENDLPWHLPADMKFFKETTSGHIVLTGRKNYDSIPERFRPLPNRLNIILTRDQLFQAPDCLVMHSIEEVIVWKNQQNEDNRTLFIIGGGEIFNQFISADLVDEMFITHIETTVQADVFFPSFDESKWNKSSVLKHEKDDKNPYSFTIYHYTK
jgi:dihydrofolate reductase